MSDLTLPENIALPPTQSALGIALHGRDPTIPPIYTEDLLKPIPTTEDLLAPPKGAVVGMKDWFAQQFDELGRMGKGFLRAYEGGLGLSGEDQKYIKDAGLEPFLKDAETNIGKAAQFAARTGVYGIPAALDAIARLPMGILYAVGDVAIEKGVPRDVFGMIEAFPAGHMAGYPGGIPSRMAQIKEWVAGAEATPAVVTQKGVDRSEGRRGDEDSYWVSWVQGDVRGSWMNRERVPPDVWEKTHVGDPIELIRIPGDRSVYLRNGVFVEPGNFVFDAVLFTAGATVVLVSSVRLLLGWLGRRRLRNGEAGAAADGGGL